MLTLFCLIIAAACHFTGRDATGWAIGAAFIWMVDIFLMLAIKQVLS